MASKRNASNEQHPPSKKPRKQLFPDDSAFITEASDSDADYTSSAETSEASGPAKDTPATPFSPVPSSSAKPSKTHRCPFDGCPKAFNRPARLQEHLRSHNNDRIFKCTYDACAKTFLRASHLAHHVKSAHTGEREYACDHPGCGKRFVTGSRLRRHLAAHDGRDKYRCMEYPPCDATFRKHNTLQRHILAVHLKQKPFACAHVDAVTGAKCAMAFDTVGHLRAHEGRVHSQDRFRCAECALPREDDRSKSLAAVTPPGPAATFPTYALLQAHIKAAHPPQCAQCGLACSTSRELRRHLDVAHSSVGLEDRKTFPCVVPGCGRRFTKSGNLKVHVRTVHEGVKRFGCGETDLASSKRVAGWDGQGCGKRYGSKLALEEHVRTAHLGLLNSKAERRRRLGLMGMESSAPAEAGQAKPGGGSGMSTLATLTGDGYVEESGRQIVCFIRSCEHRFYRDYDLWVHMGAKHGCSESEIQDFYMQRALLEDSNDSSSYHGNYPGIYGLEFDDGEPLYESRLVTDYGERERNHGFSFIAAGNNEGNLEERLSARQIEGETCELPANISTTIQGGCIASAEVDATSTISAGDMAVIDPVLSYNNIVCS